MVQNENNLAEYVSEGNAVGSTFTSADGDLFNAGITSRAHVFIGVTFTNNDGVATTPGAGSYTVTVETWENPGVFQSIQNGTTISATAAGVTLSVAGHLTKVRVTPTGITTATKFNVRVGAGIN